VVTVTGVIVTGGGSGIGRATAHQLAAAGRPVALWDLNGEAAATVAAEIASTYGVATLGVGLDVRDTARFGSVIAESRSALGSIGGFVHAAGAAAATPIDMLDETAWNATIAVHLTAAALLIRDLSADLTANPGSAIVLIASIEAIVGHEHIAAYCAAKAGMLGLSRATSARLAPMGARCNCICPGFIDTPLFRPAVAAPGVLDQYVARIPLRRLGRPEEIGSTAAFLLSDGASYITAAEIVVDGGVTRTTF
jgi:NAD(P)-dependent dehydrogenase (short-subunit alcohol dehydrogenase family)